MVTQAAPDRTIEDIIVTLSDGGHRRHHLAVWAASWDAGFRVFTVDGRNPESGIGEIYSYPAGAIKSVRSIRRRVPASCPL